MSRDAGLVICWGIGRVNFNHGELKEVAENAEERPTPLGVRLNKIC